MNALILLLLEIIIKHMSFKAINVRERWNVLDSKEILDNFSLRMNFTKKLLVQVN